VSRSGAAGVGAPGPPTLPEPTPVERWIGEGGWLVDVLLPRTDAGVAVQAVIAVVVFAVLLLPAHRAGVLQLWVGCLTFTAGLFVLRGVH
jgi:hypothetical protein